MQRKPTLRVEDLSSVDRELYDSATHKDWPSLHARKLVYIAGPLFGSGRSSNNIRRALAVAQMVRAADATPLIPHLSHFWDTVFPHEAVYWLSLDREMLARCQALVLLPGESPGARCERVWAGQLEIPVFELSEDDVLSAVKFAAAQTYDVPDWLRELQEYI